MKKWYYAHNGVEGGPVEMNELTQMLRDGKLYINDYIRSEEQNYWTPIATVKDLAQHASPLVGSGVPPLPPPLTMTGTTSAILLPPLPPSSSETQERTIAFVGTIPDRKSKSFLFQSWLTAALSIGVVILASLLFSRGTPRHIADRNEIKPPVVEQVERQAANDNVPNPDGDEPVAKNPEKNVEEVIVPVNNDIAMPEEPPTDPEPDTSLNPVEAVVVADVNILAAKEQPEIVELEPAMEARLQYEDAVEWAKRTYREELAKALTAAQTKGELAAYLDIDKELSYTMLPSGERPSNYAPTDRSLIAAKTRYKKEIDDARSAYRKRMDKIIKDFVRSDKLDDAKFVREMLERFDSTIPVAAVPKPRGGLPLGVLRVTVDITETGKATLRVEQGLSIDPPSDHFVGESFPLSAFPHAQAFRGSKGMGRVIWDFRDPLEAWENSDLMRPYKQGQESETSIDTEKGFFIQRPPTPPEKGNHFAELFTGLPIAYWPIHISCDYITAMPGRLALTFKEYDSSPNQTRRLFYFTLSQLTKGNEVYKILVCRHDQATVFIHKQENIPLPYEQTFQLDEDSLSMKPLQVFIERKQSEGILTRLDLTAQFSATAGFTLKQQNEALTVESVADKGPAKRAGLAVGDVITLLNGKVCTEAEAKEVLATFAFGDRITLSVRRSDETKVIRFRVE